MLPDIFLYAVLMLITGAITFLMMYFVSFENNYYLQYGCIFDFSYLNCRHLEETKQKTPTYRH